MLGEIGTSGNFAAMFMHQFGKAWKLRCNAQVSKLNNYSGTSNNVTSQ